MLDDRSHFCDICKIKCDLELYSAFGGYIDFVLDFAKNELGNKS